MIYTFDELKNHVGHEIEVANYGYWNVAIECVTCNEVLVDLAEGDELEKLTAP